MAENALRVARKWQIAQDSEALSVEIQVLIVYISRSYAEASSSLVRTAETPL